METPDKQNSFFRFEDLRIYHKSLDYIHFLQSILTRVPCEYSELIANPFFAAARNISSQVIEGSSRNKNQFIFYLKASKTSIRECVIFTTIAHNAGIISDEETEQSRQILMELTKMIGALITSLVRSGVKEFAPVDENSMDYEMEGNYEMM